MPVSPPPRNRQRWGLAVLLALVVVAYGRIWTRGGYSDDFYLLSYSTSQSYSAAVRHWTQEINSRISQGFTVPLLYKSLSGASPSDFNWTALHGLGLLALALSVLLLDRNLAAAQVPWRTRTITTLIFALHPIKTEALLWPAAMTVYVIPLAIFLLGTWLYLNSAKRGRDSAFSLVLPFCLILYAALSVEQFLPLFAIVLAVRMALFRPTGKSVLWNLVGFVSLSAIFACSVIFGATARRVGRFGPVGLASLPDRLLEMLSESVAGFIEFRHRTFFDSTHRGVLLESVTSAPFLLGFILLGVVAWRQWSRKQDGCEDSPRRSILTMALGALIVMGTLSPFLAVRYGLTPRAYYLPFLGMALTAGAGVELLFNLFSRNWQKALLAIGLLAGGSACLAIDLIDQNDFSRYWSIEKRLVRQLQGAQAEIPAQSRVTLLYLPEPRTVAPSLVNDFAFQRLLEWIAPDNHLSGSSLTDLSVIFRLPSELGAGEIVDLQAPADNWVLLWSEREQRMIRLKTMRLMRAPAGPPATTDFPPAEDRPATSLESRDLDAILAGGSTRTPSAANAVVEVDWRIDFPQLDLASLGVRVNVGGRPDGNLRLTVRVDYSDGSRLEIYDTVWAESGFVGSGGGMGKSVFVERFSQVRALQLSVSGGGVDSGVLRVPISGGTTGLPDSRHPFAKTSSSGLSFR